MTKFVSCKCPNCGANLKYKEGEEKVTCTHCNSDILIEKDMDQEIKKVIINKIQREQKISKVAIIVFITIFICVVIGGFIMTKMINNNTDKTTFNFTFTLKDGSQVGSFVKDTLDDVITSNKKNKDHQITVVYNDIKTTDATEITNIKKSIVEIDNYKPVTYTVYFDYDNDGYINVMTITK